MEIDLIVGARPNFVKIASITRALEGHKNKGGELRYRLVHTGQHYDKKMSQDFFEQLGIREPDVNLEVGTGSQAQQTAEIMIRYEELLTSRKSPALTLVVGDVTSTMACAVTAQKKQIPVAHVEAGIRSGDWNMPEEINRLVTDAITNWFYTTSQNAVQNLRKAGVPDDRIAFVGNTMIDTLLDQMNNLRPPNFWDDYSLGSRRYLVLTLHRPSNVDDKTQLISILNSISESAVDWPVIFPAHPRTKKILGASAFNNWPNIHCVDPQPYWEFNFLVKHSVGVITDSGGITEETTVMGVPCLTIRNTTERPETVTTGTNELIGEKPDAISAAIRLLQSGNWKKGSIPELWDGKAGERIVAHLARVLSPM